MTQPDTLHDRLAAEIDRRLAVARATVGIGWWGVMGTGDFEDRANQIVDYMRLHDPADAIRRYQRDLKTLERHAPVEVYTNIDSRMVACAYEWGDGDGYVVPYEFCPHVKDLVEDYLEATHRLGVSVDG